MFIRLNVLKVCRFRLKNTETKYLMYLTKNMLNYKEISKYDYSKFYQDNSESNRNLLIAGNNSEILCKEYSLKFLGYQNFTINLYFT